MPSSETTARLASFAAGLKIGSIPEEVADRAKILLADGLASAMFGWTSGEANQIARATRETLGRGESTVIGSSPASPGGAALINGYLTTARSVCDLHQPTLCHVTPVVVPALLATAEREAVDGATMLAGLVAGLESTVRVGLGLDYPEFRRRGWHTPGVAGPIGGSVGVARLLGLDAEATERAMGVAGSQSGGTFASFGTPTIKFHQARAAMSALLAVTMVADGFVGPRSILTHGDGGIFGTFSDGGIPEAATDGLGESWEMMNITTRLWPAAAALQSVLTMVEDDEMPPLQSIRDVTVSLPPDNFDMHAAMGWETRFQATLSARFVTSFALHGGSMWDLSDESLSIADVIDFARDHVSVVRDGALPDGGVKLRFSTTAGVTDVTIQHPKGSPANPASWDDVVNKMHITGDRLLGEKTIVSILEMIGDIETVADVRSMTTLLGKD